MHVAIIAPDEVQVNWHWIGPLLVPAIRQHPGATLEEVRQQVMAGDMLVLRVTGGSDVIVCLTKCDGEDGMALFVNYVAGTIDGGPKEQLRKIRTFAAALEAEAKRMGCTEIQGGGRMWKPLGWTISDRESGGYSLRKVLA
ncbi:hypothetical protein [Pelagibacterium luteolum]|uniref:Uncharacterized protein n=1 Tax=Pelagibacterium luteolum TaxID=440168 RepID=A0A1G7THE6_9HYPH|nr:hypothetical protein [Pelagibacterium luteolum]SDG34532.1 hypothetical protein SAMN04487974_102122 [Pelagibacterium luteolum]